MSLVLVFPTLPVTCITGILYKLLLYSAIFPNAINESSTSIIVLSLYCSNFSLGISIPETIATLAPFFKASS